MQLRDNIYYYIAYGLILVTFFIVLKTPKKDKKKNDDKNSKDETSKTEREDSKK